MKQTAVEWLEDRILQVPDKVWEDLFEQAKEMEKQQQGYSEEEVRKLSTEFFYHWYNAKGNNTEQGFDEWFEQFKKK